MGAMYEWKKRSDVLQNTQWTCTERNERQQLIMEHLLERKRW